MGRSFHAEPLRANQRIAFNIVLLSHLTGRPVKWEDLLYPLKGIFHRIIKSFSKLKTGILINRNILDEEIISLFKGEKVVTVLPYRDATQSGVTNVAAMYKSFIIATKTGVLPEQLGYG